MSGDQSGTNTIATPNNLLQTTVGLPQLQYYVKSNQTFNVGIFFLLVCRSTITIQNVDTNTQYSEEKRKEIQPRESKLPLKLSSFAHVLGTLPCSLSSNTLPFTRPFFLFHHIFSLRRLYYTTDCISESISDDDLESVDKFCALLYFPSHCMSLKMNVSCAVEFFKEVQKSLPAFTPRHKKKTLILEGAILLTDSYVFAKKKR